jgi:hypothetical protein
MTENVYEGFPDDDIRKRYVLYLNDAAAELDTHLENPEAQIKIAEVNSLLRSHILDIYKKVDERTDVVFVVGGKSRGISEEFLNTIYGSLPTQVQEDMRARVRLNDNANQKMYAKPSTTPGYKISQKLADRLTDTSRPHHVVLVEDFMETGTKVYSYLCALEKVSNTSSEAIALSGYRAYYMPESLENRPAGWWERVEDVFIPLEGDKLLNSMLPRLAHTQSIRAKLRLAGQSSEEERKVLRHAAERIQRFHDLLKASYDPLIEAKVLHG